MQDAKELKEAHTDLMQLRVALKELEAAIVVARERGGSLDWLTEQERKGRALEARHLERIAELKERTKKTE